VRRRSGILSQIPECVLSRRDGAAGVTLPATGEYGVGMIFLPREHASRLACEQELERTGPCGGQVVLGWRNVAGRPRHADVAAGARARAGDPADLHRARRRRHGAGCAETQALCDPQDASHKIQALKLKHGREYFVPSMSGRTVVYKGLLLADQVGQYYADLRDPRVVSAIALVHSASRPIPSRRGELAHPYRLIAHNGEINTVKGNFNWIRAREGVMSSPVLREDLGKLFPLIYEGSRTRVLRQCARTARHERLPAGACGD